MDQAEATPRAAPNPTGIGLKPCGPGENWRTRLKAREARERAELAAREAREEAEVAAACDALVLEFTETLGRAPVYSECVSLSALARAERRLSSTTINARDLNQAVVNIRLLRRDLNLRSKSKAAAADIPAPTVPDMLPSGRALVEQTK
jgi:hypothetical protein